MTVVPARPKPTLGGIARRGLAASLISTVINVGLFLLGSLFTFPEDALTPLGVPVDATAVTAFTLGAGIVATLGYIVLTRVLPPRTARRVMWIGIVLALLIMAGSPFGIENVPVAQIVVLEIMHLVAAWPAVTLARSG